MSPSSGEVWLEALPGLLVHEVHGCRREAQGCYRDSILICELAGEAKRETGGGGTTGGT